jgi:hypothetical protein
MVLKVRTNTLLIIALLPGCAFYRASREDIQQSCVQSTGDVTADYAHSVVPIYIEYPDDRWGICSATVIAPAVLLTAAHCLPDQALDVFVKPSPDLDRVRAERTERNPVWPTEWGYRDIGLVYLTEPLDIKPAILDLRTPTEGAAVLLAGYGEESPGGPNGKLRTGWDKIDAVHKGAMLTTPYGATGRPGDSGGPAFLNGRVVAVLSQLYESGANGFSLVGFDAEFLGLEVCND